MRGGRGDESECTSHTSSPLSPNLQRMVHYIPVPAVCILREPRDSRQTWVRRRKRVCSRGNSGVSQWVMRCARGEGGDGGREGVIMLEFDVRMCLQWPCSALQRYAVVFLVWYGASSSLDEPGSVYLLLGPSCRPYHIVGFVVDCSVVFFSKGIRRERRTDDVNVSRGWLCSAVA
jgi:hypothetical protein